MSGVYLAMVVKCLSQILRMLELNASVLDALNM